MQINFDSTAVVQTVMNLPEAEQNEAGRIGRRLVSAIGQSPWQRSEAWENGFWTALALSAIWALTVSMGF